MAGKPHVPTESNFGDIVVTVYLPELSARRFAHLPK
jgi:hypothetical protein